MKRLLAKGSVLQERQSFRLPGVEFAPPSTESVVVEDVKVGSGDESVAVGWTVVVKYEGRLGDENGATFDKSGSFDVVVGIGEVIKGWDRGLRGMKKGGVRILRIPAKLGYGKRGSGKEIPPDSNLFFTIPLKSLVPP